MPLTLYYHPLASYCHKALVALYELGTPFDKRLIDLGHFDRLMERWVLAEARPYLHFYPFHDRIPQRFLSDHT